MIISVFICNYYHLSITQTVLTTLLVFFVELLFVIGSLYENPINKNEEVFAEIVYENQRAFYTNLAFTVIIYPGMFYLQYDRSIFNLGLLTAYFIILILMIFNGRKVKYRIIRNGIVDKFNRLKIATKTISETEVYEDRLIIHTSKYKNDQIFLRNHLKSPDWEEFCRAIDKMKNAKPANET